MDLSPLEPGRCRARPGEVQVRCRSLRPMPRCGHVWATVLYRAPLSTDSTSTSTTCPRPSRSKQANCFVAARFFFSFGTRDLRPCLLSTYCGLCLPGNARIDPVVTLPIVPTPTISYVLSIPILNRHLDTTQSRIHIQVSLVSSQSWTPSSSL